MASNNWQEYSFSPHTEVAIEMHCDHPNEEQKETSQKKMVHHLCALTKHLPSHILDSWARRLGVIEHASILFCIVGARLAEDLIYVVNILNFFFKWKPSAPYLCTKNCILLWQGSVYVYYYKEYNFVGSYRQ